MTREFAVVDLHFSTEFLVVQWSDVMLSNTHEKLCSVTVLQENFNEELKYSFDLFLCFYFNFEKHCIGECAEHDCLGFT